MTDDDLKAAGFTKSMDLWRFGGDCPMYLNRSEASAIETFARARISAALRPLVEALEFIETAAEEDNPEPALVRIRDIASSALADAERRLT